MESNILTITGTENSDLLIGGSGNELIVGNESDDILTGGGGADVFQFHNILEHGRITEGLYAGWYGVLSDHGFDFITDYDPTQGDQIIDSGNPARPNPREQSGTWQPAPDVSGTVTVVPNSPIMPNPEELLAALIKSFNQRGIYIPNQGNLVRNLPSLNNSIGQLIHQNTNVLSQQSLNLGITSHLLF